MVPTQFTPDSLTTAYERNNDFTLENLEVGIHACSKQKNKTYMANMAPFIAMKPDDFIITKVLVKNKFAVGNSLDVISPSGNQTNKLDHMESFKG